jgi:hypothetical protein
LWISFLGFQLNQKDSQVAAQQIEFLKAWTRLLVEFLGELQKLK